MLMKRTVFAVVVLMLLGLGLLASSPGSASQSAGTKQRRLVIVVAHGLATATYFDAGAPGPSVGDQRYFFLPLTRPGGSTRIGYLTGSLETIASDVPAPGQELRAAELTFVVGRPQDQIVVGGIATYPKTARTAVERSAIVRPVLGGSGKYFGARGSATTVHNTDDTWTHTFRIIVD
jgi:hypothetical protein